MASAIFVSDLHLCPERPQVVAQFRDFLAGPARAADEIYILGDLFEYWAGDDDLSDDFNAGIAAGLTEASDAGTRLYFIAGNRDFLIEEGFERAAGLTRLSDPHLADICGTPTLLMHGDTLCTDDHAYLRFRSEVRTAAWREAFLARPLSDRRAQLAALRRGSELAKRDKNAEVMDASATAVAERLREYGYPRLIHGHTHRPAHHRVEVDGRVCERWVLADWYSAGSYLVCDDSGCRPISLRG